MNTLPSNPVCFNPPIAATRLSCDNCGRKFKPYPGHDVGAYTDDDYVICRRCNGENHYFHDTYEPTCPACRAERWLKELRLFARTVRLLVFKLWRAA